jgi:Protein of unknown function (DUF2786)
MGTVDALLAPDIRDKLAKLLGMSQSSHDGEALNAVRLANRMLAKHKLTWREALGTTSVTTPPEDEYWRSLARFCVKHGAGILSGWEMNFVLSLPGFPRISAKQAAILRRCVEKVGAS